ncbi:hypothetical protein [Rhodococcus sp. WY5]|uniref:hypothetical protein n=1 Tax=Rhodococcus sp. WY5 TaxID=2708349 RepID=UPI001BDF3096|nr:hypothetical protein [Rhodococcus sp. WY5]
MELLFGTGGEESASVRVDVWVERWSWWIRRVCASEGEVLLEAAVEDIDGGGVLAGPLQW